MTTRYRVLLAVAALSLPLAAVHAQDRAPTFRPSVPGIDNPRSGAAEYQDLLPERREVATLNGRLAPADKLTPAQTERLLNLLRDVGQVPWHTGQSPFDSRFIDRVPMNPGLGRLWEERQYLASLEAGLRIAEQRADLLLERLPRFLTPRQVRAYAELEAEHLNGQRASIESMRRSLGIPDETLDVPRRSLEDGPVL